MDNLTTIIMAVIGSGVFGALITGWLNKRKVDADVAKIITDAAIELKQEYKAQADEIQERYTALKVDYAALRDEVKRLKLELELLEKAIENANAKCLKKELVITINARHMRSIGIEPLIDPANLDSLMIEELRLIAESLSNIDKRRAEAYKRRAQGGEQ